MPDTAACSGSEFEWAFAKGRAGSLLTAFDILKPEACQTALKAEDTSDILYYVKSNLLREQALQPV